MDDVLSSLLIFQRNLERFNDRLNASFQDLNNHHDHVNAVWNDSFRAEYDARLHNLEEKMKEYVTSNGANYTDILIYKISILQRYLHGN